MARKEGRRKRRSSRKNEARAAETGAPVRLWLVPALLRLVLALLSLPKAAEEGRCARLQQVLIWRRAARRGQTLPLPQPLAETLASPPPRRRAEC